MLTFSSLFGIVLNLLITVVMISLDNLLEASVCIKPMDSSCSVHKNFLFSNLLNCTSIDHVTHQLGCTGIIGSPLFGILNLTPQIGQLLHISSHLLLSHFLHFLFLVNLSFCPSSLRADLEHISSNSFRHYNLKKMKNMKIN